MLIVKSFSVKAKLESLLLEQVDGNNAADIINRTMSPNNKEKNPNQFTTLIPLKEGATRRITNQLDFSGIVQPVVLEFDHDSLDHQKERAEKTPELLGTQSYLVYSGNKSYHLVLWFDHFADNPDEYKEYSKALVKYLCDRLPDYYQYPIEPKETGQNIPDFAMFSANQYFRQAGGYRPGTAKVQSCKILNDSENYVNLKELVSKYLQKPDTNKQPKPATNKVKLNAVYDLTLKRYLFKELGIVLSGDKIEKINPCPICGHNDCFTYYPNTDTYSCFSSEDDSGGDIIKFIVNYKKICRPEAVKLCEWEKALILPDYKDQVNSIFHSRLSSRDKNSLIGEIVIRGMVTNGNFYKTDSTSGFYFYQDENGKIYSVNEGSKTTKEFEVFLMDTFGINPTEAVFKSVIKVIMAEFIRNGKIVEISNFAYYNPNTFTLYLQNGNDSMYKITEEIVEKGPNGTDNVLFSPDKECEPYEYMGKKHTGFKLWNELILNRINFTTDQEFPLSFEQSKYILAQYIRHIPFAYHMPTKIVIAFIGDKGSGKTSILRMIGFTLFGSNHFNVISLSPELCKEWPTIVSRNPFLVIDNCDSKQKNEWLPDAIATTATGQHFQKRKLYTDMDVFKSKPNVLLALTARTPSFNRDDVNQRILLFFVNPIESENRIAEGILKSEIIKHRDELMTELINECQLTLQKLKINDGIKPPKNLRIADFSNFIYKIVPDDERQRLSKVIDVINTSQAAFTLQDNLLWDAVEETLNRHSQLSALDKLSTSELYEKVSVEQGEHSSFVRYYKARNFAKNLKKLIDEINLYSDYTIKWLGRGTENKTYISITKKSLSNATTTNNDADSACADNNLDLTDNSFSNSSKVLPDPDSTYSGEDEFWHEVANNEDICNLPPDIHDFHDEKYVDNNNPKMQLAPGLDPSVGCEFDESDIPSDDDLL